MEFYIRRNLIGSSTLGWFEPQLERAFLAFGTQGCRNQLYIIQFSTIKKRGIVFPPCLPQRENREKEWPSKALQAAFRLSSRVIRSRFKTENVVCTVRR